MRRTLLRALAVALFLFTTLNPTASADYDPSWDPNFASSPYTGGTDLGRVDREVTFYSYPIKWSQSGIDALVGDFGPRMDVTADCREGYTYDGDKLDVRSFYSEIPLTDWEFKDDCDTSSGWEEVTLWIKDTELVAETGYYLYVRYQSVATAASGEINISYQRWGVWPILDSDWLAKQFYFVPAGPGTYDDFHQALFYQGAPEQYKGSDWTHASGWSSAYNQTVSWTNVGGAKYSLKFVGSTITLVNTWASNRGSAQVKIDGQVVGTLSQYAPVAQWQVATTYSTSSGTHLLQVIANGDGYIDIDAFAVDIPGSWVIYDDPNASIAYSGTWVHATGWNGPYNGTVSWSNSTNSYAQKSFTGQLARYRFTKAYNRGKANITIDGVSRGQVDLYNSTTLWQEKVTYFAGPGSHTFRTTVSGQSSGTGYYIDVDTVDVMQ